MRQCETPRISITSGDDLLIHLSSGSEILAAKSETSTLGTQDPHAKERTLLGTLQVIISIQKDN